MLKSHEVDVGFLSNPSNDRAITFKAVGSERLVFVVAAKSEFAEQRLILASDLRTVPLIVGVGEDGVAPLIEILRRRLGETIPLNIKSRYDSPGGLRAAVEYGLGIGVLFEDMVARELQCGILKELKVEGVDLTGKSDLAYLKDENFSPVVRRFIEFVRQRAAQGGGTVLPVSKPLHRADRKKRAKQRKVPRLLAER